MTSSKGQRTGGCHCGAVRFAATLYDGFNGARRCNCSFCCMRGAVVVPVERGGFDITQGGESLNGYRFNTRTAEHFFCVRCGIHTHLRRRSDPTLLAVSIACLDGVGPFDLAAVPVMDGIEHPNDTGGPARRAGTLRFEPAD